MSVILIIRIIRVFIERVKKNDFPIIFIIFMKYRLIIIMNNASLVCEFMQRTSVSKLNFKYKSYIINAAKFLFFNLYTINNH